LLAVEDFRLEHLSPVRQDADFAFKFFGPACGFRVLGTRVAERGLVGGLCTCVIGLESRLLLFESLREKRDFVDQLGILAIQYVECRCLFGSVTGDVLLDLVHILLLLGLPCLHFLVVLLLELAVLALQLLELAHLGFLVLVLVAGEHSFEFLELLLVGLLDSSAPGVVFRVFGTERVLEERSVLVLVLDCCRSFGVLGAELPVLDLECFEAFVEVGVAFLERLYFVVPLFSCDSVLLTETLKGVAQLSVFALCLGELFVELELEVLEVLFSFRALGTQLFFSIVALDGSFHRTDNQVLALLQVVLHLLERGVLILEEAGIVAFDLDLPLKVPCFVPERSLGICDELQLLLEFSQLGQ